MHVMSSVSPADDNAVAAATSPPSPSGLPHICENGLRPPNPPPPPPLPLHPGLRDEAPDLRRKRVRSFFWKTIPEDQVKGHLNLWTQGPGVQQHQFDAQEIEELFGQKDCQSKYTAPPTRGEKSRASSRSQVSILDSKRALHVEIFLKQFKRSNQTLVDDIHHGNSESLGAEPLRELLKLLPGKDEEKKLKAYRGNAAELSLADSFMHLLIQVPSYLVRIQSMLLKEEFPGSCEAVRRDFNILRSAVKELMCCTELHAVLHLVLQAGNILNAGGTAGNAVGFKLSSLLSLADTKSNKPGMNLLHFVALEAQKKNEKLLEFPLKLSDVQAASRIPFEALDAELQVLTTRTRSVEESIQKDTELLQQMDVFLQSATSSLCSLRDSQQQLKKEGDELIDFFCEDRGTFRLDDCFCIFHTFCLRFTCAVKENKEREAKEAAHQQTQETELKRRSWSGGEQVRGAVGLRCSSETDMSTVVSKDDTGLLEFITPKSQLRTTPKGNHVTRGRLLNSHRTRNPPSSSPLFAADSELSTFFKLSEDHRVPRPRGQTHLSSASPKSELKGSGSSPKKTDPPTTSVPSKTSSDSTVISKDGVHDQVETVKPISYSNQQTDHNNNENNQLENLSHHQTLPDDNKDNVSGVLEKSTLVPELQMFDEDIHYHPQDEAIMKPLNQEVVDDSQILNLNDNSKKGETSDVEIIVTTSPSPQQDGEEDKVIVWCVTGVCEPAGESTQTEKERNGAENQTSSPPHHHTSSELHLDSEKSGSIPISCQPVSRCNDSSLLMSSPGPHPTEPAPASPGPGLTVDASEEDNVTSNQVTTPKKSGNAPVPSRNKTSCRHTTEKTPSTDGKAKLATSSKKSTKNLNNAKAQNTSMKPSNTTLTRITSVCSTTSSQNQNMRRVVPITKTNRGTKHPENLSAHNQSSFRTGLSTLPSTPIRHSHPSTAPQPSKMPDSKELRDQKVPGTATRTQNTDVQRRPSIRKALTKPKTQTEEKMCLLRALTQSDRGSSVSAPVTPLHKTKTTSLSIPPGFARNTASSSFRRTNASLSNTGSPKTSYKTSSSVSQTGSLRVVPSSRSTSPLRTSENIRSTRALLPKDHRDNGTVSDKSTHFRDSSRSSWANWR